MLIAGALRANRQHVAVTHGLTGTAGAPYGPFPTWVYQAYLLVSSDLVLLVAVRALLMAAVIALALLWLCRTLDLWSWFVPPLLCSPYLWFYARAIWDNSFNLPLSALAFASAVSFLARGRAWTLLLSLACCLAMMLTHLMAVAFVIPVTAFLLFRARRELRRLFWRLVLLAGAGAAVAFPYLASLRRSASGESAPVGAIADWLFPFLGGRILSAQRIEDIFGAAWLAHDTSFWAKLATVATAVSLIAIPLVWAGAGVAAVTAWKGVRSPPEDGSPRPARGRGPARPADRPRPGHARRAHGQVRLHPLLQRHLDRLRFLGLARGGRAACAVAPRSRGGRARRLHADGRPLPPGPDPPHRARPDPVRRDARQSDRGRPRAEPARPRNHGADPGDQRRPVPDRPRSAAEPLPRHRATAPRRAAPAGVLARTTPSTGGCQLLPGAAPRP